MSRGRFAPSPTGTLHLGNLRTALAAWLFARSAGSEFLLRFEDLDDATANPDHETGQRRDLETFGLDWDGEPIRQSDRIAHYRDVLSQLEAAGLTYPCWCSRREIREAAAAPHHPPGHYPGTCRELSDAARRRHRDSDRPAALRLRTDQPSVTFTDRLHGPQTDIVDDFVLRRGDGTPAYNLVVVIDDHAHGIEEVVRADDLLASTARHAHLADLLDQPRPSWAHVPLVLAPDGDRLAKRHGAVTLADRLALGDRVNEIVAVLARSLGLDVPELEVTPAALLDRFDPQQLSRLPWRLDDTDNAFEFP